MSPERLLLPIEGREMVVRLSRGEAPIVSEADVELDLELLACAARVVGEASHATKDVVVVFYPGDSVEQGRTQLDEETGPVIFVEFESTGSPFTRASALRLLRHYGPELRACDALYEGKGRIDVDVTMSFDRLGYGYGVKAESPKPEAAAFARCVGLVHYGVSSTLFAEDGSTTLKMKYWFRGSPNVK